MHDLDTRRDEMLYGATYIGHGWVFEVAAMALAGGVLPNHDVLRADLLDAAQHLLAATPHHHLSRINEAVPLDTSHGGHCRCQWMAGSGWGDATAAEGVLGVEGVGGRTASSVATPAHAAPYTPLPHSFWKKKQFSSPHLELLVANVLVAERRRLLHGNERHHLWNKSGMERSVHTDSEPM